MKPYQIPSHLTEPWPAVACVNCGWNTPVVTMSATRTPLPTPRRCPECTRHHHDTDYGRLVAVTIHAEPRQD